MRDKICLVVGGMLVATIIASMIFVLTANQLTVESIASHEFEVSERMQRVRKILVRTNAIKKIVAMADAELRGQEWLNLKFDAERPIRDKDWNLSGEGELVVVLNDAYLGTIQLTLTQQIEVSHDRLFVACNLKDASHSVERYDSTLTLVPGDNGDAKFSSTLSLQINTTANIFSRASVENGIRSAAKKALEDQANALRLVIAEKDGELFILPELKGD